MDACSCFFFFKQKTAYEVRPAAPVRVSTVDAEGYAQAVELACQEVERPFDLATGPLLRALVIRLGVDDAILVLAVEHLVFDGASCGVLLRELGLQYSARR